MSEAYSRLDRIGDGIKRELAVLIQQAVKDPRVGMVSVTRVQVSKDLAHAKVYVSSLIEGEAAKMAVVALNHAAGFLRSQLAERIQLRVMPQLRFYYDDSLARAGRMAELLENLDPDNTDERG